MGRSPGVVSCLCLLICALLQPRRGRPGGRGGGAHQPGPRGGPACQRSARNPCE